MFLNRQQFANLKHGKCEAPDNPGVGGVDLPGSENPEPEEKEQSDPKEPQKPELKYSDDDVDRIVSNRLSREQEKLEREIREKIAKENEKKKTEAKKLEEMNELERAQYEAEQLRAEKAELESRIDFDEQMKFARKELSSADIHLADDLLSIFVSSEAEKTKQAIDQIKDLFPKAVNAAVQEALKRNPPSAEPNPNEKSYGAKYAEYYSKQMNGGK